MDNLKENIFSLLKTYLAEKKKISLLRYERECLSAASPGENRELQKQLERLERKIRRLEHCVEQLPAEQAQIIQGLYFEGKTQKVLVEELHLSESTLLRYRDKAVGELVEMYLTLQEAGVALEW